MYIGVMSTTLAGDQKAKYRLLGKQAHGIALDAYKMFKRSWKKRKKTRKKCTFGLQLGKTSNLISLSMMFLVTPTERCH